MPSAGNFPIAALAAIGLTYAALRKQLLAEERAITEARLNQYAAEYEKGGLPALKGRASLRKGREQRAFFTRVADAQNRTLFLREPEEWAQFSPERPMAGSRTARGWRMLDSPVGTQLLLGYVRLSDGLFIEVGDTTENVEKVLAGFRSVSILVRLIFLLVSIVGGAFLAFRALRPIQHLTEAAEQIVATGKFDARVPSSGTNDELDALVHLFNKMLGRIDGPLHGRFLIQPLMAVIFGLS